MLKKSFKDDLEEADRLNRQLLQEVPDYLKEDDLEHLPEPVRKYIRYTGFVGKPKINKFRLDFSGKIRKSESSEWMPFTSVQYNYILLSFRLFFMKAVMKGLPVIGYHCFKNGRAFMDIRLFSLFRVQYQKGKEMDISETVTFFNDMCCMAPGTLIDKRIKWIEVLGNKVKAEFSNNGITISAWLHFNDDGELINFITNDRFAAGEKSSMTQYQWSTPLKDYKEIGGYKLAHNAEAIYAYPQGDLCYGIFELEKINYY